MKQLFYFLFIIAFTISCSRQEVKQSQPKQQQSKKNEFKLQKKTETRQDVIPDINNRTKETIALHTVIEKKSIPRQPVVTLPSLKKQSPAIKSIKEKATKKQPPAIKDIEKKATNITRDVAKSGTKTVKTVVKPVKLLPKKIPVDSDIKKTKPNLVLDPDPIEKKLLKDKDVTVEALPIQFGNTWTLDIGHDIASNKLRCLLTSKRKKFYDGYSDTIMTLQLSASGFLIKTNSKIDLSYSDIGIYIDQNIPFQFEQLINTKNAYNKKDISAITKFLVKGKRVNIKLGFWPTWPKTTTSNLGFTLQDFNRAVLALNVCEHF